MGKMHCWTVTHGFNFDLMAAKKLSVRTTNIKRAFHREHFIYLRNPSAGLF